MNLQAVQSSSRAAAGKRHCASDLVSTPISVKCGQIGRKQCPQAIRQPAWAQTSSAQVRFSNWSTVCASGHKQNPHTSNQHSSPNSGTHTQHASSHTQGQQAQQTQHSKGFAGGKDEPHVHVPHAHASSGAGTRFLAWLKENGAPEQGLELKSIEPPLYPPYTNSNSTTTATSSSSSSSSTTTTSSTTTAASSAAGAAAGSPGSSDNGSGAAAADPQHAQHAAAAMPHVKLEGGYGTHPHPRPIDMAVAARALKAGDVALQIPAHLVITLDRVFESEFVAELLTTDKLSELACLTLYLMYEKKLREESFWFPYIKELDRQRARGTQAVESPLLWDAAELEELLQGSPLLGAVKQRLAGIRKEYEELDTVWYMSQSLFSKYPFDLPTETFTFDRFKQAFAAVQASIVHLQGVPPARRFALVPLGPPLLSYSSTSKAMLTWNEEAGAVQLLVDRAYEQGEPVMAWCGPQPNSRLLLNYGLVDEHNPYDKLPLTTIFSTSDPLFQAKRAALQRVGLTTSHTWDLARNKALPPLLLPTLRLAAATTQDQIAQVSFEGAGKPLSPEVEAAVASHLASHLTQRLAAYRRTIAGDMNVMSDPRSTPRQKVAARLTKIEKGILQGALEQVQQQAGSASTPTASLPYLKIT